MKELILVLGALCVCSVLTSVAAAVRPRAIPAALPNNTGMIWVDALSGSDSNNGIQDSPLKTLGQAKTNADPGKTICVMSGTYTNNDLLKDGVNWFFYPGARVEWVDRGTGPGIGIFDDRGSGAVDCTVAGHGVFKMTQTTCTNGVGAGNTRGLITTTNADTKLRFQASEILVGTYNSEFLTAAYCQNASNLIVDVDRVLDVFLGTTTPDPDGVGTLMASSFGFYWEIGEMRVDARQIYCNGYSVWANKPAGVQSGNFWVNADEMEAAGSDVQSPIYISSVDDTHSPDWRTWIRAQDVKQSNASGGGSAAFYSGTGKHYLQAAKLSGLGTVEGVTMGGQGAATIEGWFTVQKIATRASAVDIGRGATAHISVQEIQDLGGRTEPRILVTGGTLYLDGQTLLTTNSVGISFTSGKAFVRGLSIDTSPGTNPPVLVSGNGLNLEHMKLIGPLTTNSISAEHATTVTVYYSAGRQTNNAKVTLSLGNRNFIVSPNVQ